MKRTRLVNTKNACVTKIRGRKCLPYDARKAYHISIRLTWDEYRALQQAAEAEGVTASAYVRGLIHAAELEQFKQALLRRVEI